MMVKKRGVGDAEHPAMIRAFEDAPRTARRLHPVPICPAVGRGVVAASAGASEAGSSSIV
ncbi:hypothetical protein [Burkholderia sp. AW49-1]